MLTAGLAMQQKRWQNLPRDKKTAKNIVAHAAPVPPDAASEWAKLRPFLPLVF